MKRKGSKLGKKGSGNAETFTVDGITDTLQGWAKRLGTNYHCLYKRIVTRGMDPIDAIRAGGQHQNRNFITVNGETHYINEWARITGVSEKVIHHRIYLGWTIEEALGFVCHEKRTECRLTWRGQTHSITEWGRKIGLTENAMFARVSQWRKGAIPKKDVFRKEKGHTGRRHFSQMHYYKGKRYTVQQLCDLNGVSHTWFCQKMNEGISVYNIMMYEKKMSEEQIRELSIAANVKRNRMKELRKMGVVV